MAPRLGDFGLARLYEHGADPATTRVVRTLGYMYMAPELVVSAKATTATDVFAFGALLLDGAVDERLRGRYDEEEARLVLWLGLLCSQSRPEARPSMRQVCQYLDGEAEVQEEDRLVFSDAGGSFDFGSLTTLTWSSCSRNTMSVGSLLGGR
ncbi:unnamed protein product [Urochloa humidicola]